MLAALLFAAVVDTAAMDSLPHPWLVWSEAPRRGRHAAARLVIPAGWRTGTDSVQVALLPAAGRRAWRLAGDERCAGAPAPVRDSSTFAGERVSTVSLATRTPLPNDTILHFCVESGGAAADHVGILLRRFSDGGPAGLRVIPARLAGERSNAGWWDRPFVSVAVGGLLAILGGAIASLLNHWSAIRLKETERTGTLFERLDAEIQDISRLLNQFVNDATRDPPKLNVGGFAHILKTPMLLAHLERRRGSTYLKWLRGFYAAVGQYGHGRSLWLRTPAQRPQLAEQMRVHASVLADNLARVPDPERK